MEFEEMLLKAKQGHPEAVERLLKMFNPMLIRNSLIRGQFEEDLYHELIIEMLKCIRHFREIEL